MALHTAPCCNCGWFKTQLTFTNQAYICTVDGGHFLCSGCVLRKQGSRYHCARHNRPIANICTAIRALLQCFHATVCTSSMGGLCHPNLSYTEQRRIVLTELVHPTHVLFKRCPFICNGIASVGECVSAYMTQCHKIQTIVSKTPPIEISAICNYTQYVVSEEYLLILCITINVNKKTIQTRLLFYAPSQPHDAIVKVQILVNQRVLLQQEHILTINTPVDSILTIYRPRCNVVGTIPNIRMQCGVSVYT